MLVNNRRVRLIAPLRSTVYQRGVFGAPRCGCLFSCNSLASRPACYFGESSAIRASELAWGFAHASESSAARSKAAKGRVAVVRMVVRVAWATMQLERKFYITRMCTITLSLHR